VLVSMPLHLGYLCRRPVAPVQIWLSLKFPLPNFEGLDGRVFCRSLLDRRIMIEGRLWRGGPLAITPPDPPDPSAVEAIRARYPSMRLLGTVAREEKIANAAYLDAVVGVLARHPDTCFLWTGRNPLPEIQQAFERGGVAERCHFVGWVDPAPYIMAFDLQIETYPLTGVVFGWGMSWGKPVLSVGSLGFVGTYLEPILTGAVPAEPEEIARIESIFAPVRGRLPGLWAPTPAEIGDFADALLGDPELMAALGRAQQAYVRRYLMDEVGAAAAQARHYADIVRETLAGRAA
jgi:glycosyltransferase involved in cell wall biosynthesis